MLFWRKDLFVPAAATAAGFKKTLCPDALPLAVGRGSADIGLCIYRYIHPISHAYVYTYVNTSLYTVPYDYNILLHRERYRYRRYMIMLMMVMVYYATRLFHLVIIIRRCARSQLGDHQWAHHASIAARPGKGWSFWWEDMHIWFYMYIWTYVSMYICVYIHIYHIYSYIIYMCVCVILYVYIYV